LRLPPTGAVGSTTGRRLGAVASTTGRRLDAPSPPPLLVAGGPRPRLRPDVDRRRRHPREVVAPRRRPRRRAEGAADPLRHPRRRAVGRPRRPLPREVAP